MTFFYIYAIGNYIYIIKHTVIIKQFKNVRKRFVYMYNVVYFSIFLYIYFERFVYKY